MPDTYAISPAERNPAEHNRAIRSLADRMRSMQSMHALAAVKCATTANITLSGTQTIDGISAGAGDRVLVKDQTAPKENGVYVVAVGAWSRATDMDSWDEVPQAFVNVTSGTVNVGSNWVCTSSPGGTLETTSITWTQFQSGSSSASAITEVGDTDYAILSTDWIIVTSAALTAPRTWTLPAASAIAPSHPIFVFDRKGGITSTNTITIARNGSDTIDEIAFNPVLNSAYSGIRLYSNQSSKWQHEIVVADVGVLLDRLTTTRGAIPYRGSGGSSSGWAGLAPGTAGFVLTSNGSGADPSYQAAASSAILQCLQTTYATNADLTVTIPNDDTVPTSSEGTQVLSQAITPADNTNKVLCIVDIWGAMNTASTFMSVSLLRGTTTIQVASHGFGTGTANFPAAVSFAFLDSPASASAQTYSVRVGPNGNICRLNGTTGGRMFGGASACTLTLMEVNA